MRARAKRGVTALVLTACSFAGAPGHAALLDRPPREHTFALDGPTAPRFAMLSVFRDGRLERPGPMRLYMGGRYGRWIGSQWAEAVWRGPVGVDGADGEAAPPAFAPEATSWWSLDALSPGAAGAPDPFSGWGARGGVVPKLTVADSPLEETLLARAWDPYWIHRLLPGYSAPTVASTGLRFESNGFDVLFRLRPLVPVQDWRCRRRPVQFVRYEGEHERFPLVRCDGTMEPEALDRLSMVARPNGVRRPSELLPDEPDEQSWAKAHEWLPGIKLTHPRMVWVLQQLADAFPWKAVYVFSGYRPADARASAPPGGPDADGHGSYHTRGRAMDLMVYGVSNEEVFKVCRTLRDVGCGYYPNGPFVHVDVRPPGSGHPFWVDTSAPGEPSHYVDAWPGVVEGGALVWAGN
jgi:hypothetical protein